MPDGSTADDLLRISEGGEFAIAEKLFDTYELPSDNNTGLRKKTEIPPTLIIPISAAYTIAEVVHSRVMKRFCDIVLECQISLNRKGRMELTETLNNKIRSEGINPSGGNY